MEAGNGLGLATVYGIVKQSGGHVVIESEPDAGSTIRVLLPSAGSESPEPLLRPLEPAPQRGTELVLLIDDNSMVRTTSASLLEGMGYTVLVAGDAHEALDLAEEYAGQVALVITDIVMPRMGGFELAERLRQRDPHTLVLFISGYSEDAVLRRGSVADDHLLRKPFSAAELGTAVRTVLDGGLIPVN
jgi:CheY-like chemotaxis protein